MPKPRKQTTKPFIVRLARDLSEYADVQVYATTSSEAEDIVSELLGQGQLNALDYARGDDREAPYSCDSWEKEDDEAVDCIIHKNRITFPPKTNINTTGQIQGPLTACPQCGADLNASVIITLYAITLDASGQISSYDGGPQPESESDIIELCQTRNTTITCTNNHHISGPPVTP